MDADRLATFEANRQRLFSLAYRMLGEAAAAEDIVQDAYLRWAASTGVDVPEAWLTTVVTNLSLNRLTSARAKRETYIGPWLPEPIVTDGGALGPLETVEQRESVSFGMLVLLERLTPPERAVFILREAFGHTHREIAEVLSIDEAHSRQLHRRARERVGERRKRFDPSVEQRDRIVARLQAAVEQGDVAALERLLARDVEAWTDGGGAGAARRPIYGRNKVARYLVGLSKRPEVAATVPTVVEINGDIGIVSGNGGTPLGVTVLELDADQVQTIRLVVNPAKLGVVARQLA